jgi:16S rRNA processing protein RimM
VALVAIGKVARAIGLGGFVGVGGSSGALETLEEVTLRRRGAPDRTWRVLEARPQGKVWAVRLEGIQDRDAAERLVGSEVLAERERLGEAGEGQHYWADLEGLAVRTEAGEPLGTVTGLLETGAVDVLVVQGGHGELLIPLAPYVRVDQDARVVVVDPPEGLLELGKADEKGGPERGG